MQPDWRTQTEPLIITHQKQMLLSTVLDLDPACVLDLGCREGWLLDQLHTRGVTCIGADLYPQSNSPYMVFRVDLNGDLADFVHHIITVYKQPSVIVLSHTLEHLYDPRDLIETLHKCWPLAMLVIMSPTVRSVQSLWHWLVNKPPVYSATWCSPHYKDFTTRSMREMIEPCGYKLMESFPVECATPWGDFPLLAHVPFCSTSFLQTYEPI